MRKLMVKSTIIFQTELGLQKKYHHIVKTLLDSPKREINLVITY